MLCLLWFCFTSLSDWLKKLVPLLSQSDEKQKPIVTCLHTFSHAKRYLLVLASISDWFILCFVSSVIGLSNYFGFGFTTLI